MNLSYFKLFLLALVLFMGCSRLETVEREQSMRESAGPNFSLLEEGVLGWPKRDEHIKINIKWLERKPDKNLVFGTCVLSSYEYANSLKRLLGLSEKDLIALIKRDFQFFEVYGKDYWGEILLTSYYSPVIKGSTTLTEKFSQPLYSVPKDLRMISLDEFISKDIVAEDSYSRSKLPALIRYDEKGDVLNVGPFYSRKEIDGDLVLKGKGLELAYVDPIDAFFLHIQGSGLVEFEDGRMLYLGYAAQNGHRYYSIGKSLFDVISQDEMSKDKLVGHLRSLDIEDRDNLLYENPSYVFFRIMDDEKIGQTTFGPSVIDKRTMAIDYRVFPMGAIGFLDFNAPNIESHAELKSFSSKDLKREGRFVFAHDSGGAIRGPGRADLYWGKGELASFNAGVMRHRGKMWFLAPRSCADESSD